MKRPFVSAAGIAGVGAMVVLAVHAGAQAPVPVPPLQSQPPAATVFIKGPDGTITEQTLDGKIIRTTSAGVGQSGTSQPVTTGERIFYGIRGVHGQDAESLKLAGQEQAAAQEARALTGQYTQADSDAAREEVKKKLREKLAAIFDLQQQRRAREITQIEERLGKLKETMKKRDTSKDPIIDRRLDQLTGGVDELGWEEPGANQGGGSPYGYGVFTAPTPQDPNTARYAPPGTVPVPLLPAPVPVPTAPANR